MSPAYGIHSEIRRLIGILFLASVTGLLLNQLLLALAFGIGVYITIHLINLYKLSRWLQNRETTDVPEASGLWGQVYDQIRRQQRKELREKKRLKTVIQRIQAITAALEDAVILLDAGKSLYWWNQAGERLLDLKSMDNGSSITNYIRHPDFVRYLDSDDYKIPLTLPSPHSIDTRLEYQITRFGQGESLIVVRDITRIYKLEQMRKDFVANVSHELRTPLTVIRGYLETMADNPAQSSGKNKQWQKALLQMQQQAVRMTTLIDDLTILSKLETDRDNKDQQPVVLKHLLEMICNEARVFSGQKRHVIQLECPPEITLLGNDRELHSAFSNLVTNAVKYSPPEKSITIKVLFNPANNLELCVIDQGIGIEQQHISRLTERFYRVDDSRSIETGGTGLGLAIVKHVLLRHDGLLRIKSTPNKGSAFICILPRDRVSQKHRQKTK